MKVKVSELEGRALDYAVAFVEYGEPTSFNGVLFEWRGVLENYEPVIVPVCHHHQFEVFNPSGNWADGGPKIEKREISVTPVYGYPDDYNEKWVGQAMKRGNISMGSTYLEAGMRAFILSYVGGADNQEIEIPDELMP